MNTKVRGECGLHDCKRPHKAKGLCRLHYQRLVAGRPLDSRIRVGSLDERFWSQVNKAGPTVNMSLGPCWDWTGATDRKGYGKIGDSGRNRTASRVAFELQVGAIPDDHEVCHHCDRPICVRGDHLFTGTQADNMADMYAKGRNGQRRKWGRCVVDSCDRPGVSFGMCDKHYRRTRYVPKSS